MLCLVGPKASGKSALALLAAQARDGEIIFMDSMQVYIGMDIGTAKATKQDQEVVPHHMIDIVDPETPFSVAEYQRMARDVIDDIHARGKLPVLCGGTGL